MQDHAFFIALAYGVSIAAIGLELLFLYRRSGRARRDSLDAFESESKDRP
ncbi:hypothetical protein COAQ111491_17405 [Comamonas aquatilis]